MHFYDLLLSAGLGHPGHIWTPAAHFALMAESHIICSPFTHSKFWLLLKFSISFSRQPLTVDITQEPLKLFNCISWPKNLYVRACLCRGMYYLVFKDLRRSCSDSLSLYFLLNHFISFNFVNVISAVAVRNNSIYMRFLPLLSSCLLELCQPFALMMSWFVAMVTNMQSQMSHYHFFTVMTYL